MKFRKNKLVPILWALGGVLWLVPTVKDLIKGEPVREVFPVIAVMCFALAVSFFGIGRKSGGGSGPPSA